MQTGTDGGGDLGEEVQEGGGGFEFEGVGVEDGEGGGVDLARVISGGIWVLIWRFVSLGGKEVGELVLEVVDGTYLLVDGQETNPGLTAFGESLSVDLLVGSLAIQHDGLSDNALLREVVLVDASLNLLGQL